MKILLASARLEDIRWAVDNGLLDGVVTTPSLLSSAGGEGDRRDLLGEICRASRGPVYASVRAVNGADIFRDGRELAKISDQIVVQVPFVEDAIASMRRLTTDGVKVLATLVFTPAQALLAAKAGATMVCVSVDAIEGLGMSGADTVAEVKGVFEATSCACDILASQLQSTAQVTGCALAGADAVSLAAPVLRSLLVHPLTDRGLDQFLRELSTQGKSR